MTERSIILKAPQVQALLRGATQLRLPVRLPRWAMPDQDIETEPLLGDGPLWPTVIHRKTGCPVDLDSPYQPGDMLLVKETWCYDADDATLAHYRATEPEIEFLDDGDGFSVLKKDGTPASPWRSPVTMPKWAVRLKPLVKSVQVQRLHDISEEDADACGVLPCPPGGDDRPCPVEELFRPYACGFAKGWNALYGDKCPWASNCWCWVYELEPQPCES